MAIKQIATINTKDNVLNRIQAEVQKVNSVLTCPLLNGNLVTADLLASGGVSVNHGLGRAPLGWIVVDAPVAVTTWSTESNRNVLVLNASADASVTLWVF